MKTFKDSNETSPENPLSGHRTVYFNKHGQSKFVKQPTTDLIKSTKIPKSWSKAPSVKTWRDVQAKLTQVPHISYDIDGDGVVGSTDYFVSKLFDKEGKGNLSESEKAAALIQRSWRKYTWFRVTKALQDRRNYSAFLIQRAWIRHKTYKTKKLKLQTARKDAALKIQKTYRGYKAREHFAEIHSKKVLQENLEYFDKVKRELYKESIARISKAWSDFKAIKAAKAELKRLKEIERRKRIERLKKQKTRYFTKTEEVPVESFAVSTESTNTPVNNTPKNRHITNCRVRSLDPYS